VANSTLLSLFQNTLQGMGVATYGNPSTVIGNTNQDVVQTLALLNAAGDELNREHDWQGACIEYRFTTTYYQYTATLTTTSTTISSLSSTTGLTTSPTYFLVTGTGIPQDTYLSSVSAGPATAVLTQTPTTAGTGVTLTFAQTRYEFPTDYDRLVDGTQWDKSKSWEVIGPKTGQEWQWLKSGYISTGPRIRYRPLGGLFQIWPGLASNDYLGFEYQSKYWIIATAGGTTVSKQAFTVDTDTTIFPDALMRVLIKLKYFEVKGFDTTALYRDYLKQRDIAIANDAGAQTLNMVKAERANFSE
jgi:hypothetical protein